MPKPTTNDTETRFMKRCMHIMSGEGKPQAQAVAICQSMWDRRNDEKVYSWFSLLDKSQTLQQADHQIQDG